MSKVPYRRTSHFFTHRFLWKTSKSLRAQISTTDRNPTHFEYTAYLTIYFALESYLNYIGESVFPEIWENERDFFSNGNFKGTVGKLKWLSKKLNVPRVSDTSQRPGQTISNLNKIRNLLVHGSIDINELYEEINFEDLNIDSMLQNSIEKRVHDEFLDHCFDDVKNIISTLHEEAKNDSNNGIKYKLEPNALLGSVQIESGGTAK
ncbi:MAG: hypothetical protein ACQETE_09170 [Bacteroidota bacterium]